MILPAEPIYPVTSVAWELLFMHVFLRADTKEIGLLNLDSERVAFFTVAFLFLQRVKSRYPALQYKPVSKSAIMVPPSPSLSPSHHPSFPLPFSSSSQFVSGGHDYWAMMLFKQLIESPHPGETPRLSTNWQHALASHTSELQWKWVLLPPPRFQMATAQKPTL